MTTLLLLTGVPDATSFTTITKPDPNALKVYALPVGQGDCTVIQCPSGNIVPLDCGSSSAGDNQMYPSDVEDFLQKEINKVDVIVITHPDRDHFNYIPSITRPNNVEYIIGGNLKDYRRTSNNQFKDIYEQLDKSDKQNPKRLFLVNGGQACIGNCNFDQHWCGTNQIGTNQIKFEFLAANVGRTSNQKSIVMKIVHGQWSMLLSGDMEGAAATKIANNLAYDQGNYQGNYLRSTVYKISHHGASSQANKKTWLNAIQPKYAFASSAYNHGNNRHPRCDAIMRLENLGSITAAQSPHPLYCGNNGRGATPTIIDTFQKHIYETSPKEDEMCILLYKSNNYFEQKCFVDLTMKLRARARKLKQRKMLAD